MKKEETVDFHIKSTWHAIARMYNQRAASYDITYTIGYVLLNISSANGTLATKIAPKLGLEPRSLTRILKNMEEDGLIYREHDAADRRKVWIKLTPTGIEKRKLSRETVLSFNKAVYQLLPKKKLDTFFEVISTIHQQIEKLFNENQLEIAENEKTH